MDRTNFGLQPSKLADTRYLPLEQGIMEHLKMFIPLQNFFLENIFPKLTQLGLKDSDKTEELIYEFANSPLLDRLETLDLSKGTLTDEGMGILLNSSTPWKS